MPYCEIESIIRAVPVEAPAEGALYERDGGRDPCRTTPTASRSR